MEKPRLCVFRSAKHIQAQLIDDAAGKTLVSAGDQEMKAHKAKEGMGKKTSSAFEVGKLLAKKALEKKIEKVVFDRGGYKYQGRVRALADGAREAGLKF
jgi:large subunit ribosomal protein L18